jgi:hypothetical protein
MTWVAGKVGIYAVNCPEYMLVIQAANRAALITGRNRLTVRQSQKRDSFHSLADEPSWS